MTPNLNRRIVLAARPQGMPVPADFRLEEVSAPQWPAPGGLLLQTLWLSLDPYMRSRMSDLPSYAEPLALGEVICGEAVCRVLASRAPGFERGDIVLARPGWQEVASVDAEVVEKLDVARHPPSWALGVLGMPGLTAYAALLDIGQPRSGETLVVAAATGPVGATAGQIAKLKGCRVIGIAGGTEKCRFAVETLGFDACINHHEPDFASRIAAACPNGVDIYFENVGGAVLEGVLPLLNQQARVPVVGIIAWYNLTDLPPGPDRLPQLMRQVLVKRLRVEGFIVFDHAHRRAEFLQDMSAWLSEGRVRYREDVIHGLSSAPSGLIGLLRGDNFGKLVVKVAD